MRVKQCRNCPLLCLESVLIDGLCGTCRPAPVPLKVSVNKGIATETYQVADTQTLAVLIADECKDIMEEMPGWWAEQDEIGNGAIEAVADQFTIWNDGPAHTAATKPNLLSLVIDLVDEQDDPNGCAECGRSFGPNYTGPCEH